jgi:site-specific DNA-methyltransferase (adenine-specific)
MIGEILCGKNMKCLKNFPDNHFDALVTDPPYGLGIPPDPAQVMTHWLRKGYYAITGKRGGFMGADWDTFVPQPQFWRQALRVLKPGAQVLSFFGTRTYHWGVLAMQLAGFEIRDQLAWIYGQGWPKSRYLSKDPLLHPVISLEMSGYGTALKPSQEPIVLARKPLEGTIGHNVAKWKTGGLNIQGCLIPFQSERDYDNATWGRGTDITGGNYVGSCRPDGRTDIPANPQGRFPTNIILDQTAADQLDLSTGILKSGRPGLHGGQLDSPVFGKENRPVGTSMTGYGDMGGASRFFFVAKASQAERNEGLSQLLKNKHITVKPIQLMRYLIRLVTPPGGLILDTFAGSGTTGCAAEMERVKYVLIEQSRADCRIAEARCKHWHKMWLEENGQLSLFS